MMTHNALPAALVLAGAMIACALIVTSKAETESQSGIEQTVEIATSPSLDPREQYALVKQVAAARADDDRADAALDAVRKSWQGRRYRWEMRFVGPLCQRAEACVVAPVDYNRFDDRIVQGWLPSLKLSEGAHAKMASQCQDHARCVVRFEGKLSELVLSTQLPTSMTLEDIEVLGVRPASASESWIKRRPRTFASRK